MDKRSTKPARKTPELDRSTTNSAYVVCGVSYKECQRNHAANIGGYALDGCREFMPSGDDGTEISLICAACGCHRNFHRREVDAEVVDPDAGSECSSSTSSVN